MEIVLLIISIVTAVAKAAPEIIKAVKAIIDFIKTNFPKEEQPVLFAELKLVVKQAVRAGSLEPLKKYQAKHGIKI